MRRDGLAAAAGVHGHEAEERGELSSRRIHLRVGQEHTHVRHRDDADARHGQEIGCVLGFLRKGGDVRRNRLDSLGPLADAVHDQAQLFDDRLSSIAFKAVDAVADLIEKPHR